MVPTFWNALYISPGGRLAGRRAILLRLATEHLRAQGSGTQHPERQEHFEREYHERSRALDLTLRDLREINAKLEQAVETKTALLHEVDHRVKNNLQMVSALILLQSRTIADEGTRRSLREMLSRSRRSGQCIAVCTSRTT